MLKYIPNPFTEFCEQEEEGAGPEPEATDKESGVAQLDTVVGRYLWEDQYHSNLGQVTYCCLQNENGNSIPSHPGLGYKE